MTANLVALSIIQGAFSASQSLKITRMLKVVPSGFCLALDSLCTQSYSSAAPKTTSLHALRTLVILFGLLIPQAIILWFSEEIMLLLKQDAEVAHLTAVYLRVRFRNDRRRRRAPLMLALQIIILGLPAYAVFEVLRRWLQAQGASSTSACGSFADVQLARRPLKDPLHDPRCCRTPQRDPERRFGVVDVDRLRRRPDCNGYANLHCPSRPSF